jgi:hypothetical protein
MHPKNVSCTLASALIILALLCLTTPAIAQTCQDIVSANAGDEVTVFAVLHTTDPNESGEGEPLTVTVSNGGPTITFSDYEVGHIIPSFKAATTGLVRALGTIAGADGDEKCEVIVLVNAKSRLTDEQKMALLNIVKDNAVLSAKLLALARSPICRTQPFFCSFYTAYSGVISGIVAGYYERLVEKDPLDLNFTVIPVPVPIPFPPMVAGDGVTQADADAMNALLRIQAKIVGLLRAIDTSVNRAAGAASVGNTFWEQKQVEAINAFLFQVGTLLTQEANAREALVALLTAHNAPVLTISPQDVLAFEQELASQGWPPDQLAYLRSIGLDDGFIEALRPLLFSRDINGVAGTLPAAIADPTLITDLRRASRALAPFAGVPGNANCHGVSVSALAHQYGNIAKAAKALGFNSVNDLQNAIRGFCGN